LAFVRVATYAVRPSETDEIRRRIEKTLVPLYQAQPGFLSLSIVDAGDYIVSISNWDTGEHAREGAEVAIGWVKRQADLVTGPPTTSHFGSEIVFAEGRGG
jgi:heme-degrading monooxygenase HmoA